MRKYLSLFIRILFILVVLTFLLPQCIDMLFKTFIIQENYHKPKGNSTFVSSPYIEKTNRFTDIFFYGMKSFIKYPLK